MNEQDKPLRIHVNPEPSPEEMAVISAAVVALTSLSDADNGGETRQAVHGRERWRAAGRRELLRSADRDQ